MLRGHKLNSLLCPNPWFPQAFLYDFGLPFIDNTKQKHQKEERKHAETPLKPTAAIQKSSRDQLFEDPGLLAQKNSCPGGAVEAGRGLPLLITTKLI